MGDQIRTKTGVSRTGLENWINVKYILDRVRLYNNIPKLESEESAEQGRNQQGIGLEILPPSQMLSRLPISLAQLKGRNNSENLKMKFGNYCILCTDKKIHTKRSIKVWLTLFKDGNNFYEHWE